ncbi:S-adenosyl-L-methionine-dependent methyltransferase [Irpex rosettiformis]|uniref:S-adenosyl-L-methionine-dependent methyltransferase n=1 Tax=Irpex rosettiformis TaxID=378272 RepID=A0ACB8U0X0_9APHY|nr:S-adenosyl-L-methionine-dependent methyltransferase [Irpex rosettiformis]
MSLALSCLRRRLSKSPNTIIARSSIRHNHDSSASSNTSLPAHAEWRSIFNPAKASVRDRVSLANPHTARLVAESFLTGDSITAGSGKVVIEAFPGPGALSRALLELDSSRIRKLIILEDNEQYLEITLQPLEALDPRVKIIPMTGYAWEAYTYLEDEGFLDEVETVPWENGVHPQLHFITHIPHTIIGEQIVAQLFRNIPERTWLFKYGRVPMSFVLGQWIWDRVAAPPGTSNARCKVSVVAEATARTEYSLPPHNLLPYDDHFHPRTRGAQVNRPESRRLGHPLVAANVVPYERQIISPGHLDQWDYCLRRLFVRKSTPLKNAITTLGPGAESLLKTLTDQSLPPEQRVDIATQIRKLNVSDWALIIRAFDYWPFAPDVRLLCLLD